MGILRLCLNQVQGKDKAEQVDRPCLFVWINIKMHSMYESVVHMVYDNAWGCVGLVMDEE